MQRSLCSSFARAALFSLSHLLFRRKIGPGGVVQIYGAELTSLTIGLKTFISKARNLPDIDIQHMYFYSDNVSGIKSISDTKPQQGQILAHSFYQDMLQWFEIPPTNALTIIMVSMSCRYPWKWRPHSNPPHTSLRHARKTEWIGEWKNGSTTMKLVCSKLPSTIPPTFLVLP